MRGTSLLRLGAAGRLLIAAIAMAPLWLALWWAIA